MKRNVIIRCEACRERKNIKREKEHKKRKTHKRRKRKEAIHRTTHFCLLGHEDNGAEAYGVT